MGQSQDPISQGRLKSYRNFFHVERLLAAGLFAFALTQVTSGGVWWLLLGGGVVWAALAAFSAYELVAKSGRQ